MLWFPYAVAILAAALTAALINLPPGGTGGVYA